MINFFEFLEQMQVRAIASALRPNADYIWREKCREYSVQFATPLHQVYDLDPEFVISSLYEAEFSRAKVEENKEEVLGKLYRLNDPDYEEIEQEEIESLVDLVINKENKRRGKNLPETAAKGAPLQKDTESSPVGLPTQGGLKFDDLAKSDESELGRDGYKE